MIANDLGYQFCPETRFGVHDVGLARMLLDKESNLVLQAPALCRLVHTLSAPDIAIVLMRRDIKDIIASEKRIGWYNSPQTKLELAKYGLEEGTIAKVKYQYWDRAQKDLVHNSFEVEYESLSGHLMWVPKEQRKDFTTRQYQLAEKEHASSNNSRGG